VTKRRRPSLKRLYADLKDAPSNVASLEVTEAGFRVTFRGSEVPAPQAGSTADVGRPVALLPGTPFPDDDSPIDAADLTLHPPVLDEQN